MRRIVWMALAGCAPAEPLTNATDGQTPSGSAPTSETTGSDTETPSDTDTTPSDTGAPTDDTGEPVEAESSAYADCTGTRTDSFGSLVVMAYDGLGHLETYSYTYAATNLVVTYSHVLAGDLLAETHTTGSDGSTTSTFYDDHQHVDLWTSPLVTSSYANSHDAANQLVQAVVTSTGASSVVTTDYDACEYPVRIELDVFGDGSLVYPTTCTWTTTTGCALSQSVCTAYDGSTTTTTYDADGKTLSESASTYTATWSWSC